MINNVLYHYVAYANWYFQKNTSLNFSKLEIKWFIYTLDHYGPMNQNEDDEDGEVVVSTQLTLPSSHLINLWETLYYENNIKRNVVYQLDY